MRTKTALTIGDWLFAAVQRLLNSSGEEKTRTEAALEAQILLSHTLERPRAWLLAHPEAPLPPGIHTSLDHQLARLAAGTPLPYLIGQQEFYGLTFEVSPAVLIPRPETELLVETALSWLNQHRGARQAVDVGTGSGCIAASIAFHAPGLRMAATDISRAALRIAHQNMSRHALLERVHLVQADLLSAVRGPFDLLCANLPYIPSQTLAGLPVVHHEPRLALDGGPDGLRLIDLLLADARRLLTSHALILLEIEAGQGETAAALARSYFPRAAVAVLTDLAGLPRLVTIETG